MTRPDTKLIINQLLASKGFSESASLAKKLSSMFEICSAMLSKQPHYEFSLRSVKNVLQLAVSMRSTRPDSKEDALVFNAVHRMKFSELLPEDQTLFLKIAADIFPGVDVERPLYTDTNEITAEVCEELHLECSDYFLSKVQEMLEMIKLVDGIMLVGESFSGKTTLYQTVSKVLARLGRVGEEDNTVHRIIINPKAITIKQMYGHFDELNEWNDGILATTYRNFSNMSPTEWKWLIFDGPVDPEWIENLNTVLDENRKLCLMSGEIIKLPKNTNLIFETQDCATASPATISRCGMLYMDGAPLTWDLLVKTWSRTLPEAINRSLREMVSTLPQVFSF